MPVSSGNSRTAAWAYVSPSSTAPPGVAQYVCPANAALAGQTYWANPGGAVEEGETYAQAAVRELPEETGIQLASAGESVARHEFELQLPDGEWVIADERYFRVATQHREISRAGW